MKIFLKYGFLFLVYALVSACGGGGGDGSSSSLNESPDGIWSGTFTENNVTYDIGAIVYDNELYAFSGAAQVYYQGRVFTDGTSLSGTIYVYDSNGYRGAVTLTGTVESGLTLSGTTSAGTSFSMVYEPDFDKPSSLNLAQGIWSYTNGTYTETHVIQADGSFTGSNTDGCQLLGKVSIPDSSHNLYRLAYTISNCGSRNGTYTGLGALDDLYSTSDLFIFMTANSNWISLGYLIRQ